jgi:MinD superfamily P-loop ATPase
MKLEMKVGYYEGNTGDFLKVDDAKCNGCGICARFCARGVWREDGGVYRPKAARLCAECGACWNACPRDAVIFSEPRGGTGVRFTFG